MANQNAEYRISAARTKLLLSQPFYGTIMLQRLTPVEDEKCNGLEVDANHLYYNPKWVAEQSKAELVGALAHCALHVVLTHMVRRNGRDQATWDNASDIAVNHLLKGHDGLLVPEGTMEDDDGRFADQSVEYIYNQLKEDQEQDPDKNGNGDGSGGPSWGGVRDGNGDSSSQVSDDQLAQEIALDVATAAQAAKSVGKLPAGLESLLEEILEPAVDWRDVLWPFVTERCNEEYSWNRPHRAYISEDEYFPSMYNEGIGKLVVCIDTSGSMSDKEISHCWSEIVTICEEVRPKKLILMQADAIVQSVEDIDVDAARDTEFRARGRGGTRVEPTFNRIAEDPDLHNPDAMIYLTDMGIFSYDCEEPEYPVLWISTVKEYENPPFGEVTYMDVERF